MYYKIDGDSLLLNNLQDSNITLIQIEGKEGGVSEIYLYKRYY